jgi:hypothetical protein
MFVEKTRIFCEKCTIMFVSYKNVSRISPFIFHVFESVATCQDLLLINSISQDTERP